MRNATPLVLCAIALALPAAAAAQQPGVPPLPIPDDPASGKVPAYEGEPASPRRVRAGRIPEHPHMAPNGRSNLHNDAFQSDVYWRHGPLGRSPTASSTLFTRECASVAFDSRGRIVTICVGLDRPVLALLAPRSLRTIAAFPLPPRQPSGDDPFTDFSGGGYFYLDDRDRAVIPTTTRHLYVVGQSGGDSFELLADRDLTPAIGRRAKLISALPDWRGRVWFASTAGVVGFLDPERGPIRSRDLGERISNSFAVGPGGAVYVVTDAALYRLEARRRRVRVVWRRPYANSGEQKSGQTSPGSGTTPTLLRRRYVAITDNADPIRVLVLDRRRNPKRRRLICREPVFAKGASSTDQSLIGVRRSLIAENNYGYDGPLSVLQGGLTEPGLERIDVRRRGRLGRDPDRNCRSIWRSADRAPSVVPKLSVANGLVYTYTKPRTDGHTDAWYLTALDFRNGRTVYKALAGIGLGYNNNYAPVTIGPDRSAYVGVLGGLVRIADRGRPQGRPDRDR